MMTTHTDVCDADFGDLSTTYFDTLASIEVDHVDRLGSCLRHGLNDHIVIDAIMNIVVQQT